MRKREGESESEGMRKGNRGREKRKGGKREEETKNGEKRAKEEGTGKKGGYSRGPVVRRRMEGGGEWKGMGGWGVGRMEKERERRLGEW